MVLRFPRTVVMIALVWIAAVVLSATARSQPQPARIALVITNQEYSQPGARLTNTHRDGDIVKEALERVGFKVTVARDKIGRAHV